MLIRSISSAPSPPGLQPDSLLDTYFSRFHAKPFYVLDESSVRQRFQLTQLPSFLVHAIYAVAARWVTMGLQSPEILIGHVDTHLIRMGTKQQSG